MSGLLGNQANVSELTPMPVDRVDDASVTVAVSAETVTFFSVNSGAWTTSGSHAIAASDIVAGKLAYSGILNSMKSNVGHFNDTSFSFDSGSGLTTKMATPLEGQMSKILAMTPTEQVAYLANYIPTAGQYFIDHRRGIIFGKSVDTTGSQPASYAYSAPIQGSGGPSSNVNISQVGGVAIPLDDAAFTPGVTPVQPVGFFADETATDSVGEGDTGSARMTLDRKQITSSEFKEDTAHTDGDYGAHVLTIRDDDPVAKAGTDGDYQSLTTDDYGALWSRIRGYDSASNAVNTQAVDSNKYVNLYQQDVTNETNATVARYIDVSQYDKVVVQLEKVGGNDTITLSIPGTLEDNGTAAASCVYLDCTQYSWENLSGGTEAATYTADVILGMLPTAGFKFINVTTTSSGGSNDVDYSLSVIGMLK